MQGTIGLRKYGASEADEKVWVANIMYTVGVTRAGANLDVCRSWTLPYYNFRFDYNHPRLRQTKSRHILSFLSNHKSDPLVEVCTVALMSKEHITWALEFFHF